MLAANVSCLSPAEGPPPEAEVHKRCPAKIPFSSLSWFMFLRESKPKFLPPNSFSTLAEITPNTSLVVEIPETRV